MDFIVLCIAGFCVLWCLLCVAHMIIGAFERLDSALERVALVDALRLHCHPVLLQRIKALEPTKHYNLDRHAPTILTEDEFQQYLLLCQTSAEVVRPWWIPPCYVRSVLQVLAGQYVWKVPLLAAMGLELAMPCTSVSEDHEATL